MLMTMALACLVVHVQDDRAPVPTAAAQKTAEKLIRDTFKDDYAKRDKQELGRKLLDQAMETQDDKAVRFVMFRESRDIASNAGDIDTALKAADQMARFYAVPLPPMKATVLATLGKNAKTPAENKRLANLSLALAEDAIASEDYTTALQAASAAAALAKKAQSLSLATRADARAKDIALFKTHFDAMKAAQATLSTKSDDAAAHLAVGQYLCFIKGNWADGLAHLTKCPVDTLKKAAERDVAGATDASGQVAIADAWWDEADRDATALRVGKQKRAVYWYDKCVNELSGLAKIKAEKRLVDVRMDAIKGTWIDVQDVNIWGHSGAAGEAFDLFADETSSVTINLIKWPPGEYDGIQGKLALLGAPKAQAHFQFEDKKIIAFIDTEHKVVAIGKGEGQPGRYEPVVQKPMEKHDVYVLTVLLVDGEYIVYLDGDEKLRTATKETTIKYFGLSAAHTSVRFDRLRVRKKE